MPLNSNKRQPQLKEFTLAERVADGFNDIPASVSLASSADIREWRSCTGRFCAGICTRTNEFRDERAKGADALDSKFRIWRFYLVNSG
jgi:hypothetical protein